MLFTVTGITNRSLRAPMTGLLHRPRTFSAGCGVEAWAAPGGIGHGQALQAEVDAKRLVELGDECRWQLAYPLANAFDGDGADLLSLCFGVVGQSALLGRQQDLEWVDAFDVGGHRHDCDHAAAEARRCGVGGIVADNNGWTGLACFGPASGVMDDADDLAPAHLASQTVGDRCFPCLGIPGGAPGSPRLLVRVSKLAGPQ